jgi:flagellar hook-length control protein FliK
MMQQLATPTSKTAVSSLPIDMSTEERYATAKENVSQGSRSAFEKAIANAEQGAFVKAGELAKDRDKFIEFKDDHRLIEKPKPLEPPVIRDEPRAAIRDGEKVAVNDVIDTPIHTDETASLIQDELDNNQARADLAASDAQNQSQDQNMTDDTSKEFDYINFVSQIQTLHQDKAVNTDSLASGIAQAEQASDITHITLTQDELQIIVDAQQAGVELAQGLDDAQLTKLGDAINSMLSQYQQQQPSEAAPEAELTDDVDRQLLEKMITQPIVVEPEPLAERAATASSQSAALADAEQAENILLDGKLVATDDAAQAAETVAAELPQPLATDSLIGLQTNATNASSDKALIQPMLTASDTSQAINTDMAGADLHIQTSIELNTDTSSAPPLAETQAALPRIDAAATPATDSASATLRISPVEAEDNSVLKQLALLDERSQTNTIENIKSRVEKFAQDLSGNSAKGSEFVAAMQSGLKELKEQMKNGREPGIDLKSLVSDALNQVNVDIPAQVQPKIDSALNQFAGIMTLANSINQSTQAQANQLLGLTDTQMIKESAVLHTEGTKLAQHTPSNFDKAVNIFKPEGQQQLVEKVRWMINGRNPAAEIRFDPPELGTMQIKVSMIADAATVSFAVQSAHAKEALDQALPKLRDMLQAQGIELGQSSVEQQSSGQSEQQQNQARAAQGVSNSLLNNDEDAPELASSQVIEQRITGGALGGIDYYA